MKEGQQIGSYTLLRKLGRGGFGEVWLAEKRSQFVTKKVAVKLPLDEQVNFEAIRQEAELWEQASGHPNVLPIIDADIVDGQVLIVSEFADGGSLHDKLRNEGKLPIKQAIELTIGILNGLDFLHNRKIIHRDIKPQNILLQGNTPRLADFGISRAMQTTSISSKLVGTDAYMSPESFDGKRSVQTDIWSVGVVLYQLLAGSLPFPQEHPSERIFAILTKEFPPLSNEIPNSLQRIVAKSLAKQPENRYQTAGQMQDELQRALVGIEHPTLAKTEVLHIPISNQTVTDVTNIDQLLKTEEPKKETAADPFHSLSPEAQKIVEDVFKTEEPKKKTINNSPPINQEAVQTQYKQVHLTENKPLTTTTRTADKTQGVELLSSGSRFGIAIFLGFVGFIIVITLASFMFKSQNTTQTKTDSNANISSTTPINAEVKFFESVPLTIKVDGKGDFPVGTTKFTAQNSFVIEYSIYQVDKFQLIINGKVITLSKSPMIGSSSTINKFEVTKDNLNQILQKGSNENTVSNSTVNPNPSSSPTPLEMNLEFTATEPVAFFINVDGGKEQSVILAPTMIKNFSPQNSFDISYSPEKSKVIQLKINGKSVSLSSRNTGSMTKIKITKDNLNQILQSGKLEP